MPNCTCKTQTVKPGETPPAPYAGPVRFETTFITEFDRDCPNHGHVFNSTLAADLRYGD